MTDHRLDNAALDQVLEQIFLHLQKQGIELQDTAKEAIKDQIHDNLRKDLTLDDIKDVEVQKKLLHCVTSLILKNEKEFLILVDLLKDKDDKNLNSKDLADKYPDKPELKNIEKSLQLQMTVLAMMNKLIQFDLQNVNNQFTLQDIKNMGLKLVRDGKSKDQQAKEEEDVLAKQLDQTLRNFFGGDNPNISGEFVSEVQVVLGVPAGAELRGIPDPDSPSLFEDLISYNPGQTDETGIENLARIANIAEGGIPELNDFDPKNTPTLTMK